MLQPWIVGDALGQVRTIRQLRIYGPSRVLRDGWTVPEAQAQVLADRPVVLLMLDLSVDRS